MDLRQARLKMIKAFPGGWDAMAAALGTYRGSLENRIYERKGMSVHTETDLQMQAFSGTTYFAEAICQQSGGVFMKLPDHTAHDREELLSKFNELYSELGELAAKFNQYVGDNEINKDERDDLTNVGQHIHRTVEELLGLAFHVYCKPVPSGADK